MKRACKQSGESSERIKNIFREAMLMHRLSEYGCVAAPVLQGIFTEGSFQYFLTPYTELDLQFAIESGVPLVVDDLTTQLVNAVSFLHYVNVVHRDIKPNSVLLFPTGGLNNLVKLCSWGFAASVQSKESLSPIPPKYLRYKAPEYFYRKEKEWDWKAMDLWSLGCVLAEIITKSPIFPCWQKEKMLPTIFSYNECLPPQLSKEDRQNKRPFVSNQILDSAITQHKLEGMKEISLTRVLRFENYNVAKTIISLLEFVPEDRTLPEADSAEEKLPERLQLEDEDIEEWKKLFYDD